MTAVHPREVESGTEPLRVFAPDGPETYEIIEGVRRAKAVEIAAALGRGSGRIMAEVLRGGRVTRTVQVYAASLLSPKRSIRTVDSDLLRWLETLGRTLRGSTPPPLLVRSGTRGTPIHMVLVE